MSSRSRDTRNEVNLDGITSYEGLQRHLRTLQDHFRTHADNELNGSWATSMIRALALQAKRYMLPAEHVGLIDNHLFPLSQRLADKYRVGFDIRLILQLFEVAGNSFTKLERGWRRVQIAKIAFRDGFACGEDPKRHFAAAVRLALECHGQVGGEELWRAVVELGEHYHIPMSIEDNPTDDVTAGD